jgi:hypothetical protein
MFSFFKKKSKTIQVNPNDVQAVKMKQLDYHPKIILAWAKAIEGNVELSEWLKNNGYLELNIACAAIRLNDEARTWLMENGFPHLMAFINASEGNAKAQKWLQMNNFEILYQMALAIEDEQDAWIWLKSYSTQDIFLLTQSIKKVKDEIEEKHNDIHSFGKD